MAPERRSEGRATLGALAEVVSGRLIGDAAVELRDVTHDSRLVSDGDLFVAIRGLRTDGHRFVEEAVHRGAAAVCVEDRLSVAVPLLIVEDSRRVLGPLAAEVHGHPSRRLKVVGVTGTNGKTTVTHMVETIASSAGDPSGLIGTVGARISGQPVEISRTTPEAGDLQRLLADMVDEGVVLVALEVSSHALALHRVNGTWFEVAAFTNLSHDHLDFHGDLATYFEAKAALFHPDRCGQAVVWLDDPAGARLVASLTVPVTTVGRKGDVDVRVEELSTGLRQSSFRLTGAAWEHEVTMPLGGSFNVDNAAVAAGCCLALGYPPDRIAAGLESLPPVPGRFEAVEAGQPFPVLVDYAHTPDGVERIIESAGRSTSGRVIVVIGAGGDRDRSKRPQMGRSAGMADVVVVTSDNPRHEDPAEILRAVVEGARAGRAEVLEEPDRSSGIRRAIQLAAPHDVVLILGKGHERMQEVGDRLLPFDDRVVAREALEGR